MPCYAIKIREATRNNKSPVRIRQDNFKYGNMELELHSISFYLIQYDASNNITIGWDYSQFHIFFILGRRDLINPIDLTDVINREEG